MFSSWLKTALEYGISEWEFWNLTPAELERLIKSKENIEKRKRKEKAYFDYTLAALFGAYLDKLFNNSSVPEIEKAYPMLFDEQTEQEKQ